MDFLGPQSVRTSNRQTLVRSAADAKDAGWLQMIGLATIHPQEGFSDAFYGAYHDNPFGLP